MNAQAIELEGFEIDLGSELYCERGGDHRELVDLARSDRNRERYLAVALTTDPGFVQPDPVLNRSVRW